MRFEAGDFLIRTLLLGFVLKLGFSNSEIWPLQLKKGPQTAQKSSRVFAFFVLVLAEGNRLFQ
jgi:hypothetical protein